MSTKCSPAFEAALEKFRNNDPRALRRYLGLPPRCLDCGEVDHLNAESVCPTCASERMIDMAIRCDEEEAR